MGLLALQVLSNRLLQDVRSAIELLGRGVKEPCECGGGATRGSVDATG